VRRQTSIGQEILWLVEFLIIFGLIAAFAVRYALAHHFNDRVAIGLAAIAAAVITIVLRARFIGRNARRS